MKRFVNDKHTNNLIYIYIYHLQKIKKIQDSLYYEIVHDLIEDILFEIIDEYKVDLMTNYINILKKELNLSSDYITNIYTNLL